MYDATVLQNCLRQLPFNIYIVVRLDSIMCPVGRLHYSSSLDLFNQLGRRNIPLAKCKNTFVMPLLLVNLTVTANARHLDLAMSRCVYFSTISVIYSDYGICCAALP